MWATKASTASGSPTANPGGSGWCGSKRAVDPDNVFHLNQNIPPENR
ncbi:BBE domain-containing protein [Nocardia brasiliensis]